jgi:deoxyadenosine/deoxycytidine kinase
MNRLAAGCAGWVLIGSFVLAQAPSEEPSTPAAPDSHEKIVVDMVAVMKDIAKSLAKAKDAASGKEIKPELQKLAARMDRISERLEKIGRPSKEQEAELEKKYKTAVDEAVKDFQAEVQRLLKTDYGKDVLAALEQKSKFSDK